MQQSVKERIILFIKKKGLSQKKFEKAAGLSNGYINSLRKSPTAEKMRSIIDAFPEINPQWLLTGEGEMLNQELSKTDVQKPKDEENQPSIDNSAAPDVLNKPKKIRLRRRGRNQAVAQRSRATESAAQRQERGDRFLSRHHILCPEDQERRGMTHIVQPYWITIVGNFTR